MKYLLDTNTFITSAKLHYGFEFVPGFWAWLVEQNDKDALCSCDPVRTELLAKSDEVSAWAKAHSNLFVDAPTNLGLALAEISNTILSGNFTPKARDKFLGGIDYQILAFAKSLGLTIVTHEVSAPDSKKDIKLPDACSLVGVKSITPFELLKLENARLVLANS